MRREEQQHQEDNQGAEQEEAQQPEDNPADGEVVADPVAADPVAADDGTTQMIFVGPTGEETRFHAYPAPQFLTQGGAHILHGSLRKGWKAYRK